MLKRNLQEAEARTVRVRGAGREIGSETPIVREMMMITEFEGILDCVLEYSFPSLMMIVSFLS